jgi:WhiB family transcriptional regulator, redox-sensing transcriptional regulator
MDDWRDEAGCRGEDPDLWFSFETGDQERARSICGGCEVREHCIDYAYSTGTWDGIYGGLDPDERRKLARKFGKKRHGTLSGYTTDGCRCEVCKREMTEYDRSHRPRKRAS